MSGVGVAARHHRKRRRGCAQEETPSTRHLRRRLSGASPFSAVSSFVLRFVVGTASHRRRKRHRSDSRRRASTPRLRRCRGAGASRVAVSSHLASTRPLRRHRGASSGAVPSHLAGLRPFFLRYILGTGASAPRCRRKPDVVDMGNCASLCFWKSTGDGGLEMHRGLVRGSPDVGDLTVATKVEAENPSVLRRGIGHSGMVSLDAPVLTEKMEPPKQRGSMVRLHEGKLPKLPKVLLDRPQEELLELFTPLTNEEESEVENLYCNGHSKKVLFLHEPSNIEITIEKLQCLRPRGWLNDEVINLYLGLLKERAKREPKRFLKCHFFNTFFFKKLVCGKAGYDYDSVRRWTTLQKLGYKLADCEKIFVPLHRDIHWCLAIINMKNKTLQYLDSLGGIDCAVLRILARYIMDESEDKSNTRINTSSWPEEVPNYLPLQQNGWDCGMFMLKFIDFHSRGLEPSFSQEHMEYFRKRTTKEILRLRAD